MPAQLSNFTSRDAVLAAIDECDLLGRDEFLKKYGYKRSRLYPLRHEDGVYDSKAIVGVAYGKQHGEPLRAREFSGGVSTVVPLLKRLGFEAKKAAHPAIDLVVATTYFRKNLLELYGGQLQRGIWTPKEFSAVFIFSGKSGETYGYKDGWTDDGLFRYTGEGQIGDMTFTPGNKAIRDHRENGKDILLFEDLGKGKGVRYAGLFECASHEYVPGLDKDRSPRQLIVFNLVPVTSQIFVDYQQSSPSPVTSNKPSLDKLRTAAYDAATDRNATAKFTTAHQVWRERSAKVREYVLARAAGICEGCGETAPFLKKDGSPYLEPHHTTRLADDGPDHPRWVAALCPNCHRRVHSGEDGEEFNKKVQDSLAQLENS